MPSDGHPHPVATYRVQFTPEFGFAQAAERVGYWWGLGISHVYCSPYLQSAPGSTSGYDVTSHDTVNTELGGAEGLARFLAALARRRLGQVLDIVPNHMYIGGGHNRLWMDVLAHGRASRYAGYFDINWNPPEDKLAGRVLLPVLGEAFGQVVQAGQVRLERTEGQYLVRYFDHVAPAAPESLGAILARAAEQAGSEELAYLAEALAALPAEPEHAARRARAWRVLHGWLGRLLAERPEAAEALDRAIERVNEEPALMVELLDRQHYRLAHWRTAGREVNYRRFFEINELAGLCIQDDAVFAQSHRLIFGWLGAGQLDGLRVDHIDGLRDPQRYLDRLRREAPHAWLLVEKILAPDETIPPSWPVAGTTGYDFLNLVGGLFVDGQAEDALTRTYAEFTGESPDWPAVVRAGKQRMVDQSFGGEIDRLTELLVNLAQDYPRHRDYARTELRQALAALVASFGVYRTYIRPDEGWASATDTRRVEAALAEAAGRFGQLDPALWGFLGGLLRVELRGPAETEFVLRFQQLTGPVMAKGVEDTAFYRYHRLVSLNEVGGDPGRFGTELAEFHQWCVRTARRHPFTMLATSTHDTKRGEDARLRIHLLSEMPEQWARQLGQWSRRADRYRRAGLPDRNAEYLLYQTLVGTWPIGMDRLWPYLRKAVREAKVHTAWTRVDEAYEDALRRFAEGLLNDGPFREAVGAFTDRIRPTARLHSLAQTLLHCTAPGVPDFYQGAELWNETLVDPDNRHAVDYARCEQALRSADGCGPESLMERLEDGAAKVYVIRRALIVRRRCRHAFGPSAQYEPLAARGEKAGHVVAFRRNGGVIVVAPRLLWRLGGDWADTALDLPEGAWRDVLNERTHQGAVPMAELLAPMPVALLVREE